MKLVALAFACVAASPAVAEDWVFAGRAGTAPRRSLHYIDRASIATLPDGRKSVRQLRYFETPPVAGVVAFRPTEHIDCKTRRLRMTTADRIGADGKAISTDGGSGNEFPVAEPTYLAVCTGDWSKTVAIGKIPVIEAARRFLATP